MVAEFERPKSLTSVVTDHVRNLIVNGDVPLGSVITERKIAAELNVSKTPVREALAQMRNEGLVTIFPQSGVRVFTLSATEVREICAFRKALEAAALTLAMQVHPGELKNALSRIVDRMETALDKGDQRTYLALDTDFHLTFFDWCDNGYLKNSYSLYSGKISALRTHLANKPQHTALSLKEHGEIVGAVGAGDTAKLVSILEDHIGRTQETYEIGIEDIAAADKQPR
jgi:DNA-binding GntR family transcriptional regulator